jgi:hypothetical protein
MIDLYIMLVGHLEFKPCSLVRKASFTSVHFFRVFPKPFHIFCLNLILYVITQLKYGCCSFQTVHFVFLLTFRLYNDQKATLSSLVHPVRPSSCCRYYREVLHICWGTFGRCCRAVVTLVPRVAWCLIQSCPIECDRVDMAPLYRYATCIRGSELNHRPEHCFDIESISKTFPVPFLRTNIKMHLFAILFCMFQFRLEYLLHLLRLL